MPDSKPHLTSLFLAHLCSWRITICSDHVKVVRGWRFMMSEGLIMFSSLPSTWHPSASLWHPLAPLGIRTRQLRWQHRSVEIPAHAPPWRCQPCACLEAPVKFPQRDEEKPDKFKKSEIKRVTPCFKAHIDSLKMCANKVIGNWQADWRWIFSVDSTTR